MGRRNHRIIALIGYFGVPILVYGLLIFGGLYLVARESLGYIPAFGMVDVTFGYYIDVLSSRIFLRGTLFSVYLAVVSTLLSTVIGVYLAQYMVFTKRLWIRRLVNGSSRILVILPYLYMVYLVIFTFSDTGFLARLLHIVGVDNGIGILFDPLGIGMILSFVLKGAPFVVVYVLGVMDNVKKEYAVVSRNLGASHYLTVRSIYIPLCKTSILWCAGVLFAYTMGSFEVPMLLSTASQNTLSVSMYRLYTGTSIADIPSSMAMNIYLLIVNIVAGGLFVLGLNRWIGRGYR